MHITNLRIVSLVNYFASFLRVERTLYFWNKPHLILGISLSTLLVFPC
jgi:hypothetical protein